MWEAKVFDGNRFTLRGVFEDKYDACEQADAWASAGMEVWVCRITAGRPILDRVFKG